MATEKETTTKHEIKRSALAWWLCDCGKEWRNHHLKGKTDDDLRIEAGRKFHQHLRRAGKRGRRLSD